MSNDNSDENFEYVVDLVRHNCEELVDDPDLLDITYSLTGTSGAIEVCGPSSEIAKIMGSRKKTLIAIQAIMYAVASKYGFRVMLNVINDEQRAKFRNGQGTSGVSSVNNRPRIQEGPLLSR